MCDSVISACWVAGSKEQAQATSDLLDDANRLLEEFDSSSAALAAAGVALEPPPPPPPPELAPAAPKLPPETFFLTIDQVKDCLTINIDSSILLERRQHGMGQQQAGRRGGWPLGKKRKVYGGGQAGQGGVAFGFRRCRCYQMLLFN